MHDDLRRYLVDPGPKPVHRGVKAAASTDSAIVTETILEVLADGGNAADAAIAGCMVQAAVEPFMTNHTGTVTMLYWDSASQQLHCLDSTGTHPKGLAPFRPIPSGHGPYAAAVPPSACIPGFMPGMKAIHAKLATKPWADLCAPAIRWAESGHAVSSFEFEVTTWGGGFTTYFPSGRSFYLPEGRWITVGEIFRYPEMARTLEQVAEHGPDWMITGGWGQEFVRTANAMGWAITADHMEQAPPPRWVDAHRFAYGSYEVASLAPPQLQGLLLDMTLGIVGHLDMASVEPMSAEHLYYMASALAIAARHYGYINDPNVFDVPVDVLSNDDWQRMQARLIRSKMPKRSMAEHVDLAGAAGLGGPMSLVAAGLPSTSSFPDQPSGSCELSIVDEHGNWCQMMNTLQSGGIPGMVIGGIPMVGSHATFGAGGSAIDTFLGEGIRMRSTIGNTMVFSDGAPVFQLGTPGNVHCTVPQVLSYWANHGMAPYEAASAPRLLPLQDNGTLVVEDRVPDATQARLKDFGVTLRAVLPYDYHMGSFQMCFRDPETGELCTTADPRRCAVADGLRD